MLLFTKSFPVMETPECTIQAQAPRSDTPLQDEDMTKVPMASLTIEKVVYRSLNVDDSFHEKTGMIIQILNSHCPGSPLVIGGIRINLNDINQVPKYLEQNRAVIKQHAAKVLLDHWITLNYGMGCNEGITVDDFGLTFTIGSVSQLAVKMNPHQRPEGPLFFCHFPALVEPQTLEHENWHTNNNGVTVHIINAYISLLPLHQRRNVILRKEREDKAAASAVAAATPQTRTTQVTLQPTGYTGTIPKKSRPNPHPTASGSGTRPAPYPARPQPTYISDNAVLREEMGHLHALINRVQSQIVPTPALPTPRTPVWPRQHQGPDLPDGL